MTKSAYIIEEYINRNQLKLDWFIHVDRGCAIFRSRDPSRYRWLILQVEQKGVEHHPKNYEVSIRIPKHDGMSKPPGTPYHTRIETIGFDQFDPVMRKLFSQLMLKMRPVLDPIERELTLWEMFIFSHDSQLSKLQHDLKTFIKKSTYPPTRPIAERYSNYKLVQNNFQNKNARLHAQYVSLYYDPFLHTADWFGLVK